MGSEILSIRESNDEELFRNGIVTTNRYTKVFCLDVKYPDGIRENLYFGWPDYDTYAPCFEGWTIDRYDMLLIARIERFAWRYRDVLLEGADINQVVKNDPENILRIDCDIKIKTLNNNIININKKRN